ncbi:MAG: HAD-IIIC family phosphatase, partial [Myxococcota bacterium]|nr:HAD-IIIC family phosphatase [Myxococcota bacterium]
MFNYHHFDTAEGDGVSPFAWYHGGVTGMLAGLPVESIQVDQPVAHSDLALLMPYQNGRLYASWQFNVDLFQQQTIVGLQEDFVYLISQMVALPESPLGALLRGRKLQLSKLVITATFAAGVLEEVLGYWLRALRIPLAPEISNYAAVTEALLDASGPVVNNAGGATLIVVRLEDWCGADLAVPATGGKKAQDVLKLKVAEFRAALEAAVGSVPQTYIVALAPAATAPGRPELARVLRNERTGLIEALASMASVHVVDGDAVTGRYAVDEVEDQNALELAHMPYTRSYMAALGTDLARQLYAMKYSPPKVIVVDCDNTLWAGVCGEIPPSELVIHKGHLALQSALVQAAERGILICLVSKNLEEDVLRVFRERPDMSLRLENVTAMRVNWDSKSENLASLAEELDVGLNTFAVLDDSDVEIEEIRARCPSVTALRVPAEGEAIERFVAHLWLLDARRTTEEDRNRRAYYRENRSRSELRASAPSFDEFLSSLELVVSMTAVEEGELDRLSQLTVRTTQFTLLSAPMRQAELRAFIARSDSVALTIRVRDRFGDYGVVGLILAEPEGPTLSVETFLMSCRVLGRRVELQVLEALGSSARQRGCRSVKFKYKMAPRSAPMHEFLRRLGLAEESSGGYLVCRVAVDDIGLAIARACASSPIGQGLAAATFEVAAPAASAPPGVSGAVLEAAATRLSCAQGVVDEVWPRAAAGHKTHPSADDTVVEVVRAIWQEVLG